MHRFAGPMAVVQRVKLSGMGEHVGVLQPDGNVFHTSQGKGVEVVSLRDFAAGKPVQLVARISAGELPHALERIQIELLRRQPYDPISNNCEIVARRVTGQPQESPQVQFWVGLAALIALFALSKAER